MNTLTISVVSSPKEAESLDELLWSMLWKPLGLPRNIRQSFKIDGETIELIAKIEEQVVGGLVAVWTSKEEIELRHLAVVTEKQNQRIGQDLVVRLLEIAAFSRCRRIHTIARNTSVAFFRKLGFTTAPGIPPEHPVFQKHGISFELMEKEVM